MALEQSSTQHAGEGATSSVPGVAAGPETGTQEAGEAEGAGEAAAAGDITSEGNGQRVFVADDEAKRMQEIARIRLAGVQTLTGLANSDSRVSMLLEAGVGRVLVQDMLDCPSTNFDLSGLKAACDVMRNLCVPAHLTAPTLVEAGAVPALAVAASGKARDQNAALSAAVALRLLLEKAPADVAPSVALALARGHGALNRILSIPLANTHPMVRVELCRSLALATPHLADYISPSDPFLGAEVEVQGLTGRPELNGTQGRVLRFLRDKGRYEVKLQSGSDFSFKPANLRIIAATSGSGSSPGSGAEAEAVAVVNAAANSSSEGEGRSEVRSETAEAGAMDAVCDAVQTLGSQDGLQFVSFLFAAPHPSLLNEASSAFLALRRLRERGMQRPGTQGQAVPELLVPEDPLDAEILVSDTTPLRTQLEQQVATMGQACPRSVSHLLAG